LRGVVAAAASEIADGCSGAAPMPRDPAVRNRTCGYLRAASGVVRRRANAS